MPKLKIVLAAAACLASLHVHNAGAQMYKWVDEKGVTQYTEAPPPDSAKGKKVDVKPASGSGPAGTTAKSPTELDQDFRRRKIARESQEQTDARTKVRTDNNCAYAQRQLGILKEQVPVYQRDAQGQRVYIEDNARPAEMARYQDYISKNCN